MTEKGGGGILLGLGNERAAIVVASDAEVGAPSNDLDIQPQSPASAG